jgi:hypothetical protein
MKTIEELKQFFETELAMPIASLEEKRRAVAKQIVIANASIGVLALVIISAISMVTGAFFEGTFHLLFGAGAACVGISWLISRTYTSEFKDIVIAEIVRFIDPALTYNKLRHISEADYMDSQIFRRRPERFKGDDLVSGTVGVTRMEFSEIHSQYSVRTKNGRRWVTIFKGLFFIADFNKHFMGETFVLPDTAVRVLGGVGTWLQAVDRTRGELVKMDDPAFEREFAVYSTDQIEARYILSTSLMKRILDFRMKHGKKMYLSFVGSKVFFAISYRKNLFEPKIFRTLLDFEPIREYFEDLHLGISIVEELNLNTRIWTKQ